MTITPMQIKAARALLSWTQRDLAEKSKLAPATVLSIENNITAMSDSSAERICEEFVKAGVDFIGETGVSLSDNESIVKVYEGVEDFKKFYNTLFTDLQIKGGIIRVSGVEEDKFVEVLGGEFAYNHSKRVNNLPAVVTKVITFNNNGIKFPHASYKNMPSEFFYPIPCYIYGDMVAHIIWRPIVKVVCIFNKDLAKTQALQFELIWETIEDA